MTEHYSADEIAKSVNAGDTAVAAKQLNADYLNMSTHDFKTVVDRMSTAANANQDSSHHALVEKDDKGDVKAILITNEVAGFNIYNSTAFKQDDYRATAANTLNPAENFNRLGRVFSGALDIGADKKK